MTQAARKSARRTAVKRPPGPAPYAAALDELVETVFDHMVGLELTCLKLSTIAGVSDATVYRLRNRNTRLPQYRTVVLLARAVGLRVRLVGIAPRTRKGGGE